MRRSARDEQAPGRLRTEPLLTVVGVAVAGLGVAMAVARGASLGWPRAEGNPTSSAKAAAVPSLSRPTPVVEPADAVAARPRAERAAAPARRLVATARSVSVYEAPSLASASIGYLRAGASVERGTELISGGGCADGFYAIAPRGFVCVGDSASIDESHPAASLPGGADRTSPLPYRYGISRFPTPPLYSRVPTYVERARYEPELHYHVRHQEEEGWQHLAVESPPLSLAAGASAPRFDGGTQAGAPLLSGRAIPGAGFAFLSLFGLDGYAYGLSTELSVLPLDRLQPVEPSPFQGLPLGPEAQLPVAFATSRAALLLRGDPERGELRVERHLDHREALPLTGNRRQVSGRWHAETTWGDWAPLDALVVVEPLSRAPSWAQPGRRWIDVSILQQTLVAYEGTQARWVTLVSTGKGGLDGSEAASTVRGTFLVHAKHVTRNMGRSAGRNSYDLRDVPYVQYFHEGYALHGTYWHDGFGSPRSHGCINLAPRDARWLFDWTEPHVPPDWHGASGAGGTLVYVHP